MGNFPLLETEEFWHSLINQDKTTKDTKRINCPKTSQHENVFLKTSLNGCLIKTFTD